jgi:hypothetical protein
VSGYALEWAVLPSAGFRYLLAQPIGLGLPLLPSVLIGACSRSDAESWRDRAKKKVLRPVAVRYGRGTYL